MVFTVEPMINQGGYEVQILSDGWTTITVDGKLSAQFEHTIAITPDGPRIMTMYTDHERQMWQAEMDRRSVVAAG
jgi:methionyl aminopeptidase